ncbi:MAG: DeoR/GlpR transcriptional regulator [Lachnospiraceae bacterium]|jgi:DeoR family fructose operon transcriptional repressor|nr:DeoR/GlpR transcriptional regulator [Lachnospiraceae bacterium]
MLTQERRERIVAIINERKVVTVAELEEELRASAATVRRDLTALHEAKRICKVFGGATTVEKADIKIEEDSVVTKASRNMKEKTRISKYAASLIQDNDFVFIDSGTTTLEMIKYINNTKAKYVTNGIVHAKMLLEKNLDTTIFGGRLKSITEAVVGPDCLDSIAKYHFTKAFIGTNGISTGAGFTTPDVDEASVKRAAISHAHMVYVLADHTKFEQVSAVTFAKLSDCCILTDQETDKKFYDRTIIRVITE